MASGIFHLCLFIVPMVASRSVYGEALIISLVRIKRGKCARSLFNSISVTDDIQIIEQYKSIGIVLFYVINTHIHKWSKVGLAIFALMVSKIISAQKSIFTQHREMIWEQVYEI